MLRNLLIAILEFLLAWLGGCAMTCKLFPDPNIYPPPAQSTLDAKQRMTCPPLDYTGEL